MAARAETTPDAPLLIDEADTVLTCAGFAQRVDETAAALADLDIGEGTRVAWQLPTRISSFVVMAALRRLDAVQAPIIHSYRDREVAVALRTAEADAFLVPGVWNRFDYADMAARIAASGGPAPWVSVIGWEAPRPSGRSALSAPRVNADEIRWLYFTSGSSGTPKAAQHTDTSLLVTGTAFAGQGRLGRRSGEVGAMAFPVAHVGGIEYLISAMAGGFPILMLESFVPDRAVELFRRHRVTTTGGAPPFYLALLAMARARARRTAAARSAHPEGRRCAEPAAPCRGGPPRSGRDAGQRLRHDRGADDRRCGPPPPPSDASI